MNMNARDIAHAIVTGNHSNDDLDLMVQAIKLVRANLARKNKAFLSVGDHVQWRSSRHNRVVDGKIEKIATKFVTVNAGVFGRWRVAANMLSEVSK
jgi:hypothetical protein